MKQEWDNIPGIVPRYIIYLSKYVNGLSDVCREFTERETVAQLRLMMEGELKQTNVNFVEFKKLDQTYKTEINEKIATNKGTIENFRSIYDLFSTEATKLNEKQCKQSFNSSMEIIMKTLGKHVEEHDKNSDLKQVRDQQRMFSFK